MKKEKDHCKDCAEYGSEFCPECLEEQTKQDKKLEKHQLTNQKSEAINTL